MLPIQSNEPGGGAFSALHGGSVAHTAAGQGAGVGSRVIEPAKAAGTRILHNAPNFS